MNSIKARHPKGGDRLVQLAKKREIHARQSHHKGINRDKRAETSLIVDTSLNQSELDKQQTNGSNSIAETEAIPDSSTNKMFERTTDSL